MIQAIKKAKDQKKAQNGTNKLKASKPLLAAKAASSSSSSSPSSSLSSSLVSRPLLSSYPSPSTSTSTLSTKTAFKPSTLLSTAKPSFTFSSSLQASSSPSLLSSSPKTYQPITIKSSYFKEIGKYSAKGGTAKASKNDEEEREMMMSGFFDFDAYVEVDQANHSSRQTQQPQNNSDDESGDFLGLFDDFDDDDESKTRREIIKAVPVFEQPADNKLQLPTEIPYPFFKDRPAKEKSSEPQGKARTLKRHYYHCRQNPPPYSETMVR